MCKTNRNKSDKNFKIRIMPFFSFLFCFCFGHVINRKVRITQIEATNLGHLHGRYHTRALLDLDLFIFFFLFCRTFWFTGAKCQCQTMDQKYFYRSQQSYDSRKFPKDSLTIKIWWTYQYGTRKFCSKLPYLSYPQRLWKGSYSGTKR